MIRHIMVLALLAQTLHAESVSPVRRTPVVEAVQKALPSVVNIGTEKLVKVVHNNAIQDYRSRLFEQYMKDQKVPPMPPLKVDYKVAHSLGSGVIVDPAGFILTNYHVIERATKIKVTLPDGTTCPATMIAGDEISDLALVKIDLDRRVSPIRLAGDNLLLGETVVVLGHPYGEGQTVTVGVLSAKDRKATHEGKVLFQDILQTDAAVNPGSSGGPLINLEGDLIGINVAFNPEAENIGYAVPVKRVRNLLTTWLSPDFLRTLWLGYEVNERAGVLEVTAVDPEGPVSDLNLYPGDLIVSLNGTLMNSLYDYNKMLLDVEPGDQVDLEVERSGERHWLTLVVSEMPQPSAVELASELLGLEFAESPGVLIKELQFNKGLPITRVVENSPAAKRGLEPGLIVTRVNGRLIHTLDDMGRALERVNRGDSVNLVVVRIQEANNIVLAQSAGVQLTAE